MFRPDHSLDLLTGDLLAELGIDPLTVREVIDDDRAIRCPERAAIYPERRFADLVPEPSVDRGLHEAGQHEPWGPGSGAPSGRTEVEEGLKEGERTGVGGVGPGLRSFATIVINLSMKEIVMAFGLNKVQIIGRLGADVTVNHLTSGGRVANLSIATDESYLDRTSGNKVDKTEWHRVVTFQDGLIDMFEKHAVKGRLVYVDGKLQTRRWKKDGEDSDRFSTEILLVPGGRVQFLDKPNGNGAQTQPDPDAAGDAGAMPAGGDPTDSEEIPF